MSPTTLMIASRVNALIISENRIAGEVWRSTTMMSGRDRNVRL